LRRFRRSSGEVAVGIAVIGGLAGIIERAWLLFHVPINADESIVGLMAEGIRNGHFNAFYWGQAYGGAEPYAAVGFSFLFGTGPVAVSSTASMLAIAAAALAFVCALQLSGDEVVATLAAATVWVWPEEAVWHSTTEFGFRGVTLVCGLACTAAALRIERKRDSPVTFGLLGIAAGVGWWSSPEIIYFLVPTALLLFHGRTSRIEGGPSHKGPTTRGAAATTGFVVGALPWIVANIRSNFASLKTSSTGVPPQDRTTYFSRLSTFFRRALPQQLGLRNPIRQGVLPLSGDGRWVLGTHFGPASFVVAVVAVVAMIARCLYSGGFARRLAIGLIAFPLLYAWPESTYFWQDGRYGPFLPVLLVLAATALAGTLIGLNRQGKLSRYSVFAVRETRSKLRHRVRWVAALIAAAGIALGALGLHQVYGTSGFGPSRLASDWGNPEDPVIATINAMTDHRIRVAWTGYWIGYVLDDVGAGRVHVGVIGIVRQPSLQTAALGDPRAAWLFYPSTGSLAAVAAFQATDPGPLGWDLPTFEHLLSSKRIGYTVVPVGVLDAVLPDMPVTPATLGITPNLVGS
jgi:hypothetical protein